MKSFAIKLSLCVLALTILPVNCFGKRYAPPPDPRFVAIDQIAILPVVDLRAGKKDKVNLESLRKTTEGVLKRKNYTAIRTDNAGTAGEIVEEDLNDARPEWIKRLGPPESRWVMVVGLGDVHSSMTFGSTGNAQVIGFLFDKQDGSVLWKGTGVGQAGQGGLAGMMMKGMMKGEALDNAMFNLLGSFPNLPKKRK
jgi:hypothetical protein